MAKTTVTDEQLIEYANKFDEKYIIVYINYQFKIFNKELIKTEGITNFLKNSVSRATFKKLDFILGAWLDRKTNIFDAFLKSKYRKIYTHGFICHENYNDKKFYNLYEYFDALPVAKNYNESIDLRQLRSYNNYNNISEIMKYTLEACDFFIDNYKLINGSKLKQIGRFLNFDSSWYNDNYYRGRMRLDLPYCFDYGLLLNREYKPIGYQASYSKFLDYSDPKFDKYRFKWKVDPICFIRGSKGKEIHGAFFNDGNPPWHTKACLIEYKENFQKFSENVR